MIDRIGTYLGKALCIGGLIIPYAAIPLPTSYALASIGTGLATTLYGFTIYARSKNEIESKELETTLHTLFETTQPLKRTIRKMNWAEIEELKSRIKTYDGQTLDSMLTITAQDLERHEI